MIRITEPVTTGSWDDLNFLFAPQLVLFTALKLGLFQAVARGEGSVQSIASATECSVRGVRGMLNCMTAMGLLDKEHERYELSHFSRRYFLPSSEDYVGNLFIHCDYFLKLWLALPQAVRTGKPMLSVLSEQEKQRWDADLVEALFQVHKRCAWSLADLLEGVPPGFEGNDEVRILDLGAGSAVWSIPIALRHDRARVTAVDFAPVLEVTRKYVRRFGVEERYEFIGGDMREMQLGSEEYDLALLGHVCHSEGPGWSRNLIGKCRGALKEKGRLLIMDHIPDEERRSDILPLLFSLNALLGTAEGDTFTFSQYQGWLLKAGFSAVRTIPLSGHSPVVVGLRG